MHTLRTRLILTYLAVLLLGMGVAGALAWQAVERMYLENQRDNLLAQARLLAASLEGSALPQEPTQGYSQSANALPGFHSRLLDQQGAVLMSLPTLAGETPVQLPSAEDNLFISPAELLERAEIQQARQGQPASAMRSVASAGNRRVLYAAAPVLDQAGNVAAVVYLATPLPAAGLPPGISLQLAGAAGVAGLLAAGAGVFLARRVSQPLEALARAAQTVRAGDLQAQVSIQSDLSELDGLTQAFNAMTASLRQAEQAKNAFIADVTHELRTPLTVIKGTIETLEDGALDDIEGRMPLLSAMQRETERLIRLVNDLLTLTRADAGVLQLQVHPLDLAELARLRCAHLAPLAATRQVQLHVRRANPEGSSPCFISGDADRLAQVLDNLLDNAIRHAAEGSTVEVSLEQVRENVECAVSDHGPGISAEHLPLIFERFYRVEPSRNRRSGGAGLGLAIARALLQAHGGWIRADSAPGQGTTITFGLPAAPNCHKTA